MPPSRYRFVSVHAMPPRTKNAVQGNTGMAIISFHALFALEPTRIHMNKKNHKQIKLPPLLRIQGLWPGFCNQLECGNGCSVPQIWRLASLSSSAWRCGQDCSAWTALQRTKTDPSLSTFGEFIDRFVTRSFWPTVCSSIAATFFFRMRALRPATIMHSVRVSLFSQLTQ